MHFVGKLQSFVTFWLVYHVSGLCFKFLTYIESIPVDIVQIKVYVGSFEAGAQTRERDVFECFV